MKSETRALLLVASTIALSAIATQGCSEASREGPSGSIEQPFGASSCSTVTPNVAYSGRLGRGFAGAGNEPEEHTSPASYDNCFRGYVVDISNFSSTHSTLQVSWADAAPTSPASCESAWVGAIFYKKVGSAWVQQGNEIDAYGSWSGACTPPSLTSNSALTLVAGESYRIAATARNVYGGSLLHALHFSMQ